MNQFELLKKYIEALTSNLSTSLIVQSIAGYGKTETTLRTLKEMGYNENQHFKYASNYISPLELYKLLEEVNKLQDPKILVLDDIEEVLKSSKAVGLLRSSLWEADGKRVVNWLSGTYKIQNNHFQFFGKIIFLLNDLNKKSPIVNALKDRALYFEMKLSREELFELMRERAKQPFQNIPYHQRLKVVEYLEQVGKNSNNISLRLLPKALQLYCLAPNSWQVLVKSIL